MLEDVGKFLSIAVFFRLRVGENAVVLTRIQESRTLPNNYVSLLRRSLCTCNENGI